MRNGEQEEQQINSFIYVSICIFNHNFIDLFTGTYSAAHFKWRLWKKWFYK